MGSSSFFLQNEHYLNTEKDSVDLNFAPFFRGGGGGVLAYPACICK